MAQSKKRNSKHDYTLLAALLLLIIMGLVILYSTVSYTHLEEILPVIFLPKIIKRA